jgi:hypothetical protein
MWHSTFRPVQLARIWICLTTSGHEVLLTSPRDTWSLKGCEWTPYWAYR